MPTKRLIGLVLLVAGVVVLGLAYQRSETFGDQTKHFFTGDYRDRTTQMIVGGAVATLLGIVALFASGKRGG